MTANDLGRLEEDEDALRSISPAEGALGRNASDYHNMWALFQQIVQRASAMNEDPEAFLDAKGAPNTRVFDTWTKMVSTAYKILEGLNKMRNSDRLTSHILEKHTRALSNAVAVDLGIAIREVLQAVDTDSKEELKRRILKLMNRGVPDMFGKAAVTTMTASKEEFGLLN